jgi:4-hydroxybenzoate polyprenyltransferase/phosphoserine phosphatase
MPTAPVPQTQDDRAIPLVVDLDGTLIRADMLHESAVRRFRADPLSLPRWPLWLARGKAYLKQRLTEGIAFDPAALPYNGALLDWLQTQRQAGRRLVLCTASDQHLAQAIADHLGLFDEVLASDGNVNLKAEAKAAALTARFGPRGFDYAGNDEADFAVWSAARRAIVVNASGALERRARARFDVQTAFGRERAGWRVWLRALRLHHWVKNVLLFVPLLAAHHWFDGAGWLNALLGFLAFGLCASSVYLTNDLMDLESDRRHPRKRQRPLAAGALSIPAALAAAPLLLAASYLIAWLVNPRFVAWLTIYFVLTCAYSLGLKRLTLVDCLTLAILYTLRIIAGSMAVRVPMSFWALTFSGALFLSLALVKRYAELLVQQSAGREVAHGRGYVTGDAPLLRSLGVAAGYMAVVVLSLYLNSDMVRQLYRTPQLLALAAPIVVYWVSWIWLCAARGQMHDDPLVFAFKDRASLIAGLLFALVMAAGNFAW